MELGWGALALIIVAAAVAWFWQDSLGARERANAAATRACEEMGLQFLDGTVAFARIVLTRATRGALTLRRTYVFDYTANNIERRQGFVVLTGQRIESVGYAQGEPPRPAASVFRPYIHPSIHEAPPTDAPAPEEPPQGGTSNAGGADPRVLRLDDWRARKRSGDRQN